MKNHSDNRAQRKGYGSNGNPFNVVKVAFSPKAFEQIKKTIGSRPAESGGALFGKPEDLKSAIPYISNFVFDDGANATRVTYTINTKFLNPVIHDMWDNHALELHGIIHSHPGGCSRPSGPDMEYFHNMHTYMERPFLITPIIFTEPDGGFKMFCYLVGPDTPAIEVEYCVMDEKEYEKAIAELGTVKQEKPEMPQQGEAIEGTAVSEETAMDTVDGKKTEGINCIEHQHKYDEMNTDMIKNSKVVIVSEEGQVLPIGSMLAHYGVGEIVAFDNSTYNFGDPLALPTQTVLVLESRIKGINPSIKYTPYGEIRYITQAEEKDIFSSASIVILVSNSIYIAAYGAKIAKKFHIPTIWACSKPTNLEMLFSIPDDEKAICCWYRNYLEPETDDSIEHSLISLTTELAMAIIQKQISGKNYQNWLNGKFDRKYLRTQVVELRPDTPHIHAEDEDGDDIDDKREVDAMGVEEHVKDTIALPPGTLNADTCLVEGINYSREADAVDIDTLKKSRIVIVGTGGMYEGASMFARCGVGEIIAIDPDTVDNTNLCRQGYLPRQVGMKKVDALGDHIREINPEVEFKGYPVKCQDLTPEQEEDVFKTASVAIFTTDSFEAQAYGNKIALRYNIPAIWGGFYEKSLASEIVFYIPGVTPACFRCAVSPRYKFQEEYKANNNGKELSISSSCNTIFHSALLDAQIGMLAMAIIHNKVEGKTFSGWFGDYFDKNLVQMKVNPLYQSRSFDRVFAESGDSAFLFESVWQHIEPERPPKYALCPDCHGGNNLESTKTENEETSEDNND